MKLRMLRPEFVDVIPDELEAGVLYVSMVYAASMHKCACGCGRDVVTPLSPTDWQLHFDGKNISLYPSIGNCSVTDDFIGTHSNQQFAWNTVALTESFGQVVAHVAPGNARGPGAQGVRIRLFGE